VNRAIEIAGFLAQHGWDAAQQTPLEADFSPRRFARLTKADGATAFLMDADADQKTLEFVKIAKLLRGLGVTAPDILAADPLQGLVLMEDFGDRNIGKLLDAGAEAKVFYLRATDVLVHLHQRFDANAVRDMDLPVFGGALFATQVELFLDAYFLFVKNREATLDECEGFRAAWKDALKGIEALPQTLMLRDFMPDNLMSLPQDKIGVLDFQDAGLGPIAYDLASLCEVVRRGGGDKMLDDVIAYYHERAKPQISLIELTRACRVLAAQRHLRIIGIIARMAQKGRREKLAYLSRISSHLDRLLQDEALEKVREWVAKSGIFA
jgi:aminoglycoside/choline kinase family phosphotransferase